jgi:DNA excision repair protein ERCC-2
MPTGTGKTITLLSLVTSYQLAHPEVGKLVYCTRTVPEMEKVLVELGELVAYRARYFDGTVAVGGADGAGGAGGGGSPPPILALGLSSRKNLCVNPAVAGDGTREGADAKCRRLTASWVRERAGAGGGGRAGDAGTGPSPMAIEDAGGGGGGGGGGAGPGAARPTSDGDDDGHGPPSASATLCGWYEGLETAGVDAALPPGVYTLADLRAVGRKKGWCPYFLARRTLALANVIVFNYQYMLDPKVANLVSRDLEKECVVVFDEAHNIDTVCIEALSVALRPAALEAAARNVRRLKAAIDRSKATDAARLRAEYDRLLGGLRGAMPAPHGGGGGGGGGGAGPSNALARGGGAAAPAPGEEWLAHPALPDDVLREAVPGNIRRAEHFVAFLRRLVDYFTRRLGARAVEQQSPPAFLADLQAALGVDGRTLRFCYDRLASLLKTLEIADTDEFGALHAVADFATLAGTYAKGFAIIVEPWDDRAPSMPDPVIQLACLDASLAIRPVFAKFGTVAITSGTLSPIDLYPRILDFRPVVARSLAMTLPREGMCPVVLTRGADQGPVSTKFEARGDDSVLRNYGRLLVDLAGAVPDGLVCFFVSYSYMDAAVAGWADMGILADLMARKLVFVETADVVETTLALDNYRRACDCGRGAVFLSVARGKVAEGIDFDRHYGRAVVMMGVPYQYTLSRVLRARLEYLREGFQIRESDYLAFDAVRQAAQCVGRVIRSKADYGLMVFADSRYQRADKRDKLPAWIASRLRDAHLNLSTDMLLHVTRGFMRAMAQPFDAGAVGAALLSEAQANALDASTM